MFWYTFGVSYAGKMGASSCGQPHTNSRSTRQDLNRTLMDSLPNLKGHIACSLAFLLLRTGERGTEFGPVFGSTISGMPGTGQNQEEENYYRQEVIEWLYPVSILHDTISTYLIACSDMEFTTERTAVNTSHSPHNGTHIWATTGIRKSVKKENPAYPAQWVSHSPKLSLVVCSRWLYS